MSSPRVRTSAKALIMRDERILVTENRDSQGFWYILPGGGQIPGETLIEALQRECREEIGTTVEAGDLKFIREYIADHHEPHDGTAGAHQIDFMFSCRVPEDYVAGNGEAPDTMQHDVRWMTIAELRRERFFPRVLLDEMEADLAAKIYLGDVN